jgi:hypothetical protein
VHRPRASQVHRAPSARSPLKSPSPALRRQSFSMSSFSTPPVAPAPTNTYERARRTPWDKNSSDLQVVTGGVLPREENNGNTTTALDNVSPLLDHTPEPDSEHSLSSQAPLVARDNSRFTRNEETGNDPKGSIEKTNTVGPRRNTIVDEGNESGPGSPGYDAYWAQHHQTRSVSRRDHTPYTAHSPNIIQPNISRREQPHNPSHRNDSRSPHAHSADESREKPDKYLPEVPQTESQSTGPIVSGGHPPAPLPSASPSLPNGDRRGFSSSNLATPEWTAGPRGSHTNLQPDQSGYHPPRHSHGKSRVSKQPSPHPPPGTATQRKPSNAESAPSQKRSRWSRWSCSIGCVCNRN